MTKTDQAATPPVAPAAAKLRAFAVRVQRSRAIVYSAATCLAAIAKLFGVLAGAWWAIVLFLVLANLSALLFGALYRRGTVSWLGVPLRTFWMALDVAMITGQVWLSGGSASSWYVWYLANVCAAAFVAGRTAAVVVMIANAVAYTGLVVGTEPVSARLLTEVVGRLALLYGAAFFALMGIGGIQAKRRMIAALREQEHQRSRELAESEERFRRFSDASFEGIGITEEGRIVDANPRLAEILRCTPEELIGRSVLDFVDPADHALVWEHLRSGSQDAYEHVMVRADGSRFPGEVQGRRLLYGGRTLRVTAVRDITERKQIEETLGERELQFRSLAETTGVGILIVQDGRYTYANTAAERMTGYAAGEVVGISFLDLVHPDFRDLVRERSAARLAGARDLPSRYDIKGIAKGGEARWFDLTSGKVVLGGKPALVATIADITEQRRLREVQAAIHEISEATQTTGSLDHLYRSIHAIIGRLMNARNLYIALRDPTTDLISFPYFVDEIDPTPEPFLLGPGMTSYVIRSGRPLLATPGVLSELEARGEIVRLGADSIDWLGVPLKVQDRVIGVLAVQSYIGNVRYSDEDKEVLSYVSAQVAQAIERKRAEEALRWSETQLQVILESTADGILAVDNDGKVIKANRRFAELWQIPPSVMASGEDQVLLAHVLAQLADPDAFLGKVKALYRTDAVSVDTLTFKDGRVFERVSSPMTGESRTVGRVWSFRDVTERVRADDLRAAIYEISEAAQQAVRLDDLFAAVHRIVGRLMAARNFYIALYNPATNLVSFPYFVDEMDDPPDPFPAERGMTSYVVHTGRPLLATPEVLKDLEERGEIQSVGAESVDWLGVPLKVEDRVVGVLAVQSYSGDVRYTDADKEVLGYVSGQVAQAVERRRAQEELERSRAELLQMQKMEAVGSLAGGVAHDFNNLLQALLSQTQLLHAYSDDAERVKALGLELGRQISHGASLTRQLLLFSRRETTRPEPLDLNDAVGDATAMLRRLVRANIALEIDLAPETLPVTADRSQLDQVMMNLTVNASDAMPEGGKLTIRTGAFDGEHVVLTIEDTGAGIPEGIRDRIFEPFFTTKVAGKGTGLGLSVVHGIVTQHGGRIEVESAADRGSTFRVILPRVGSVELVAVKGAPETVELPAGMGERILVVEDEDAAREGLRDILRSLGYEVVAAASGEEAEALPAAEPFDVLLTDLMLPGISGSQLAPELQQRWPSMRVILMSGYPQGEAVRRGIGEGSIRFLQKPFDMGTLALEIRSALAEDP